MLNSFDITFFSLITLTSLIISFLLWLVIKTLKEGRKALNEINKDLK